MAELFSFLPLLFCIVAMTVFNKPAKFSLPLTWVIACLGGILIWKMDLLSVAAYSLSAVFNSLDVLITIFGAILLMCTLKASGGTNSINNAFHP